jgi:O-antigen/teichoic acid export membrane protein
LAIVGQHKAFSVLLAMIGGEFAVVAFQFVSVLRSRLIHVSAINWDLIRASLVFGLPLIAYELSSLILDSADRFIVQRLMGDHPLGLYSAAYGISGYLQDVIMTPLNLALFPVYMRLWNEHGKDETARFLSKTLSWFLVISFFVVGASTLCSRDALLLLASRRFSGSENLLLILVPGLMLYALHIFFNVGLILQKRTTLLASIAIIAAIVNIGANLFLIPRLGLIGAATATLISYAFMVVSLIIVNQDIVPLKVHLALTMSALGAMLLAYPLPASIHLAPLTLELLVRATLYTVIFVACMAIASRDFRSAVQLIATKLPNKSMQPVQLTSATVMGEGGMK